MADALKYVATLVTCCLVGAVFAGFACLKAYDEFKKGVAQNSRYRIWSAFVIVAFFFLMTIASMTKYFEISR